MTDTPQTKTTHTPGPWEADIYHGAHGNSVQIRARGKRRADVAQAYCDLSGGVTVAEQDANGHLLAAAPTMLAALAELRKAARAARLAADAAEARLEEFTRILETVANGKDKGNG